MGAMQITGILLAAGMSRRMGYNKLLLPYHGRTVVEESLQQLQRSTVDQVIVVTGFEAERISARIARLLDRRTSVVHNSDYALGRAESIKCALRALDTHTDAALFMVADKPAVSAALIDRALAQFRTTRPGILYIKTPAGRGHPIIFARRMFSRLARLSGDVIGDDLLAENAGEIMEVPDERIQLDLDTEEDYRRLKEEHDGYPTRTGP